MNRKRIIHEFGLLMVMLLMALPMYASYDFKLDGIFYKINSDKETVNVSSSITTYYGGMNNTDYIGDIVVPEYVVYKGMTYTVTGINDFCTFMCAKALRSIVLPSTITSLPSSAFYECSALSKIVLGENLESIPSKCFLDCVALREVSIPSSVKSIVEKAFQGCTAITRLTIPENVTSIDQSAFVGCKALSELIFSDSPKELRIGYGYYEGEYKGAFDDCPLYNVYIGRNITNLYKSSTYSSSSILSEHKTLSEVTFGKEVTKIHQNLLADCRALTTVTIQGLNLKEIQSRAFKRCYKLQNIKGEAFNSVEVIGESAFADCPLMEELILPQIISIGKAAFDSDKGRLEKVFLGDKISVIPQSCFAYQPVLKHVYLGSAVSGIEPAAFYDCTNLTNIFLLSENLVTGAEAIPSTVSKIFVVSPARYENLLKDFHLDYLVHINPLSAVYSGSIPNFTYVNNVLDTNAEILGTDFNINVGEYNLPVSVNFTYKTWNSIAKIGCSYVITPAPLTVIANDASRKYGTENPELTCSFFGFKNGETKEVLTRHPNVETTATLKSNVGTYPIIATGAEAKNYTFSYERGTLTITKADQEIEWEQLFSNVNVGDVIELTATSSAGLPIKYSTTDETIADIFSQGGKKYVEFLKPGNVAIRATQEGDNNYNEADRVSKSIIVNLLVSGITLNHTSYTLAEGSSVQLEASVTPDNASNKALNWESSNTEIASVDSNGKVTALSQGITTITVTTIDGSNVAATCEINVIRLATSISLNFQRLSAEVGSTYQLIATILPEDATNKDVVWSSSDEKVATVDKNGLVSVISKGICAITAATVDGSNLKAECEIQIYSGIEGISHDESSDIILVKNGVIHVVNKDPNALVRVFSTQGILILETFDNEVGNLESGLYIVTIGNKRIKVKL